MVQQAIDILGLSPGLPKASDDYAAVDTTDFTQSTIGSTKKYLLADLFTFILQTGGFVTLPHAVAASTANYNATYDNMIGGINATLTDASGTFGPFIIDSIPGVVTGPTSPTPMPYLIKNQTDPTQNGIYYLQQNGNGVNQPWRLIRVFYFNSAANIINGEVLVVTGGATQSSTAWQVAVTGTVVVGTTPILFNPFLFLSTFLPIPITVPFGGTGDTSFVPYAVITGGTTSTNPLQQVSGLGTSGQVLVSNGAGTLPTWQAVPGITPSPLTEVNDTNVTLTLGGTPATALLKAVSLTLGWTGQLAVPRGGTGDSSFTAFAVICGGTTSTGPLQNVVGLGTANQVLVSNGAGALPSWQSVPGVTPAALTEVNDTNVTMTLGGTPATALLQAVSMTLGWTGQLAVSRGGTGNSTFTAFSVICAGTTATGPFQNVVGLGSTGNVLTSQGAGALPIWAAPATSGTVTSIATNNGVTGGTITTTGTIGLAAIANNTVLANISGGSLFPSSTTLTALIDSAIGSTQGDILYRNATTWVVLPPSTSGFFLQTQGAAANPIWSAGNSGTVTSIATNNGLTGGTITTTGTLGLASIANNTVLANISGGSTFPSSTTLTALIDAAIGNTQGDILYRNASSWVVLAPGTSGQVLSTGGAAANPSWIAAGGTGTVTSISAGTGITLTPNPITTTGTVSLTGNPGLVWSTVSGASQAMTAGSGYNVNGAGVTTMSLPTSGAAQFSIIAIQNSTGGGTFQITQAAGQTVMFGNKLTTTGVGGSITSTAFGDYIYLWCFSANLTWFVQGSIGNFTIV